MFIELLHQHKSPPIIWLISGQFKTILAAQNFAMIRSVIDTIIKNGQNILNGLNLIAKFEFQ